MLWCSTIHSTGRLPSGPFSISDCGESGERAHEPFSRFGMTADLPRRISR